MSSETFWAYCYEAASANCEMVNVTATDDGALSFTYQGTAMTLKLNDGAVTERLGNTPRFINFPSGLRLETEANDAIDRLLKGSKHRDKTNTWRHIIENRLPGIVLISIVIVAISGLLLYRFGIPLFAALISPAVPDSVREVVSEHTLSQMDQTLLAETSLLSWEQRYYRELFESRLQPYIDATINLQFRNADALGANAFALPDGTVVFTDQLLALINDDEFLAIAAHEAGHVEEDHGMRSVISATSLVVAIMLVTGDSAAVSELLITAPSILIQLSYSRDLETEADDYAMHLMRDANIPLSAFATGLEKIVRYHGAEASELSDWSGYLSTHPNSAERILKFQEAAP